MTDGVRIWEVGSEDTLAEVPRSKLDREERIEKWITQEISVLDASESGLLIIGRQVRTDFGGEIDLLCIDSLGDLVIVELKRDRTPREVTAQALDYAAWIEGLGRERIEEIAADYLKSSLEDEFQKAFPGSAYPDVVNANHSIQIVASEMSDSTERIIRYLSAKGIDINFVRFRMFRSADGRESLVRTFTVPPDQAEQNALRNPTTKRTLSGKTLETRLAECHNEAEREFLTERLEDPKQLTGLKKQALFFTVGGQTRFRVSGRTTHAKLIQKGRFEGDEEFWNQALSTNKVGFPQGGKNLSLQLVSKHDFDFFYQVATKDAHSFKWSSEGTDGANEEEEDEVK